MNKSLKKTWQYYILLLPALLLSFSVILVPAVRTVITSFTDWNGLAEDMNFIGFANYKALFTDSGFWKVIFNNVKWMCMYLVVPVAMGMAAAFFLVGRSRSRNAYQIIYLLPYVIAPIANALIWQSMIYSPLTGIVSVLKKLGLAVSSPLSSTRTALAGVAAVDIWHYWGFLAVIYFSALRQTPGDQIEAAKVEGCSGWQLFKFVYFPCIKPTFVLMAILIVIQSFMNFDYVYLLTNGGPAKATEMLGVVSYKYAFNMMELGKASTVALIMSLFGMIASIFYVRLNKNEEQS